MSKPYNYIYEQLVKSPDDIQGIIAYSVYKRQKIDFISNFKQRNQREIEVTDIDQFNQISTSACQLEFYKNEASSIIQAFLNDVLEADLKERETLFKSMLDEKLKENEALIKSKLDQELKKIEASINRKFRDDINNTKPNHWFDILKGALGSVLFVFITGLIYFLVWSFSVGFKDVIEAIFNIKFS